MQKSKPDTWALRSITSTFQVLIHDRRPTCINSGLTLTSSCGFGWRFGIDGSAEQVTNYREQGAALGQQIHKTTLRLYFDPHLIVNASFGDTTIAVMSQAFEEAFINPTTLPIVPPSELTSTIPLYTCRLPGNRIQLGSYVFAGDFDSSLELSITVTFAEALDMTLQASPSPPLTQALRDSIAGSEIIDVKFLLFSSRSSTGVKGKMMPLFANSRILRGHSTHLDALLSANSFKEAAIVNLDDEPSPSMDAYYDYDSDSDLDLDEEEFNANGMAESSPSTPPPPDAVDNILPSTAPKQRTGKIFPVRDRAYRTWRSFLHYLYGETITFNSLKSTQLDASTKDVQHNDFACSPKSMYRLADEYGLDLLQKLSKDAIVARLSEDNIVDELFSSFTYRYDEMVKLEVAFFCKHKESTSTSKALCNKLTELVAGELPGRAVVLQDIYFALMAVERPLNLTVQTKPDSPPSPPNIPSRSPSPPRFFGRGRGRGGRR